MLDTKKLHYIIAIVTYPITMLHFLFTPYTTEDRISGIVFYTVAFAVYVGLVRLFCKK
ncbi:hypothetical protein [Pseudalkalibacillus sp. SCS-8]|uniref:hypothetical protein n=1 Tax=Pseudalkalibacillus nanhaiensis TaxID=3115291 RepID=UPI0032DAA627